MDGASAAALAQAVQLESSIAEQFKPAHGPCDGLDITPFVVWGIVGVLIATLYAVAFALIGVAIAWAMLSSWGLAAQWLGYAARGAALLPAARVGFGGSP